MGAGSLARVEMADDGDVLIVGAGPGAGPSRADVVAGFGDVHAYRQNDLLMAAGSVHTHDYLALLSVLSLVGARLA